MRSMLHPSIHSRCRLHSKQPDPGKYIPVLLPVRTTWCLKVPFHTKHSMILRELEMHPDVIKSSMQVKYLTISPKKLQKRCRENSQSQQSVLGPMKRWKTKRLHSPTSKEKIKNPNYRNRNAEQQQTLQRKSDSWKNKSSCWQGQRIKKCNYSWYSLWNHYFGN